MAATSIRKETASSTGDRYADIRDWIKSDWPRMLVALGAAVLAWFWIAARVTDQQEFSVPARWVISDEDAANWLLPTGATCELILVVRAPTATLESLVFDGRAIDIEVKTPSGSETEAPGKWEILRAPIAKLLPNDAELASYTVRGAVDPTYDTATEKLSGGVTLSRKIERVIALTEKPVADNQPLGFALRFLDWEKDKDGKIALPEVTVLGPALSNADIKAWVARAIPRIDLLQVPQVAGITTHSVTLRAPRADSEPDRYAFVSEVDGVNTVEGVKEVVVTPEVTLRIRIELKREEENVQVPVLKVHYRVAVDLHSRANPPHIGGVEIVVTDARDPDGLVIKTVSVSVPKNVHAEIRAHAEQHGLDLADVLAGSIYLIFEPLGAPTEVAQKLYYTSFVCKPSWTASANADQENFGIRIIEPPEIQFELTGSAE